MDYQHAAHSRITKPICIALKVKVFMVNKKHKCCYDLWWKMIPSNCGLFELALQPHRCRIYNSLFFKWYMDWKKMWNTANRKSLFPYKAIIVRDLKHPPNRWPAFGILKNPCWAVPSAPLPENLFSSWRNFWPRCSSIQAAGEPSGLVSCPPGLVGSPID